MGGKILIKRYAWVFVLIFTVHYSKEGPPYFSDDPDPVQFHHWEFYLSSESLFYTRNKYASGTLPHFEVNYGILPNVQLHLVLPNSYQYSSYHDLNLGYTYTEGGVKYRFVKESKNIPEIGIFPLVEIPTIKDSRFGDENYQVFLPIWFQKSWKHLTTYGGAGYWINPGTGNKNWVYAGWQGQCDFSETITLGGELYYHTADSNDSEGGVGFNLGGYININEHNHILFSAGHNLTGTNTTTGYVGYQVTI